MNAVDSTTIVNSADAYRPRQAGLYYPQPPEFSTAAEERLYRKQRLAAACRVFARAGFDYGFAGHITVRDPEEPDKFWTNPFAHGGAAVAGIHQAGGDAEPGRDADHRVGVHTEDRAGERGVEAADRQFEDPAGLNRPGFRGRLRGTAPGRAPE